MKGTSGLFLLLAISLIVTSPAAYPIPFFVEGSPERESQGGRLLPHAPIVIRGDMGFLQPLEISGVVRGSGAADDPYVIEGWKIDASQAQPVQVEPYRRIAAGILIVGTTANFVIRNVWVGGGGLEKKGIWLDQVTGGFILESTVTGNDAGIGIIISRGTVAMDNVVVDNNYGIRVGGWGVTVRANSLRNNNASISFAGSNNTIAHNLIIDTRRSDRAAISGCCCCQTVGNIIEANVILRAETGILLEADTRENRVLKNWIAYTGTGILLFESFNNTVSANTILDSRIGMYLVTLSMGNIVSGNVFRDMAWYAMLLWGTCCLWNLIVQNEVKDSDRGIWILESTNNIIEGNRIVDSIFPIGVFRGSFGNIIGDNQLIDVQNPPVIRPDIWLFPFPPPDLHL